MTDVANGLASDEVAACDRPREQRSWFPRRSRADIQLIGRVGGDPDIRFAGEGLDHAWARFSVATESRNGNSDEPDWHTVIVRGRLAQFVARYLTRGRLVHVVGWLTYRPAEGREYRHRLAEIHASEVLFLDRPAQRDGSSVIPEAR